MHRHDDVQWVPMKTARDALHVDLATAYRLAKRDAWPTSTDEKGRKAYSMQAIRATARRRREEDLAKMRVEPGHETYVRLLEFERRNPARGGTKEERIRRLFGLSGTRYWQMLGHAVTLPDVVATNEIIAARILEQQKTAATIRLARALGMHDIDRNTLT